MKKYLDGYYILYNNEESIPANTYKCGYCGNIVASNKGYKITKKEDNGYIPAALIYRCPKCNNPTFFDISSGDTIPGTKFGREVKGLPDNIKILYDECRINYANDCFTSAQMIARTLLMHIAVEQGAEEGKTFAYYIEYLDEHGYIPPNGKSWVDFIRNSGNVANHQIVIKEREETEKVITFLSSLLLFIYELPNEMSKGDST